MTRRPLILLAAGLTCLALSVALRTGHDPDPWVGLLAFGAALLGGVSLLVGFYAAAFLAGGQKVAWPMAIYVVTIVGTVVSCLIWFKLTARPGHEDHAPRFRRGAAVHSPTP